MIPTQNQTKVMDALDKAISSKDRAEIRVIELEAALNRMIHVHEYLLLETEGRYPEADAGCIECTVGTVPNRLNTGLCAYHTSKKLLGLL